MELTNRLRWAHRYWGEPPILQQWWEGETSEGGWTRVEGEWRDVPTESEE